MKVFMGLIDVAGQMRISSRELNEQGHLAVFYDGLKSYLKYGESLGNQDAVKALPNLSDFDIFDVYFASFNPEQGQEKNIPKNLKVVHHFCGSEVRQESISKKTNPHIVIKDGFKEEEIVEKLKRMADLTDACYIKDMELYDHVKPYFDKVGVIPRFIDIERYTGMPTKDVTVGDIAVAHAPSDIKVKGTQLVVNAVDSLKKKSTFDFNLISGMRHDMAQGIIANSDIVVDQLHIGTYGQLAIEAMAMGCIVVCYISDYMKKHLPDDCPIVMTTPKDIEKTLDELIHMNPARLAEMQSASHRYATKYHGVQKNIHKLVDFYKEVS